MITGLTREALLRSRGYDESVIAGANGAALTIVDEPAECVMCGEPIGDGRPRNAVTCSRECSIAHRKDINRAAAVEARKRRIEEANGVAHPPIAAALAAVATMLTGFDGSQLAALNGVGIAITAQGLSITLAPTMLGA
jgi:hypothetical protein